VGESMPGIVEALTERIARAFDGVPRGTGVTWHEAEELDCYGTPEELAAARLVDTDQRWQEVREEWIETYSCAAYFLDPLGFRYYLPAIMIWSLRHGEQSRSATPDNILALLSRQDRQQWCEERLTAEQRSAVAAFVDHMLKYYWAMEDEQCRSLRAYWGRFLQ